MSKPNDAIPAGFVEASRRGPFTSHNGPVYRAVGVDDHRSGLLVLTRHCNGMGFLHGGMLAAFADSALAWGVWGLANKSGVTIKLSTTYLDIVREGAWIEARPEILGERDGLIIARAEIVSLAGETAAIADAVFRLLRRGGK